MEVQPGENLLHYRIVDKLGEGGMGVVWRAVDTTLDREVAIKVLPDSGAFSAAADDERLARFEREARLLASLNHPNIAAVYGLHEADGRRFIAMELVAGEDLAERLQSGSMPLAEVLAIARQITAALAAAHDSGVIHRDLKPANIRLTSEGRVKVLDFGLAKALDPIATSESVDLTHSPTLTSAGTQFGVILGTAAYMSPEQARGLPADRRADLWAFGCVLYEMLTGRPVFGGETVSDVLAAILRAEPELEGLAGRIPRRLLRLLERCLEKDPAKRLRDAGDLGLELEALLADDLTSRGEGGTEARPRRVRWRRRVPAALLALAIGAALGWIARTETGSTRSAGAESARRFSVTAFDGRPIRSAGISRDGTTLVLGLDEGAYLRRLDSFELRPIPDAERLEAWSMSPDGQSLLYYNLQDQILGGGELRRMSLVTGTAVPVQELEPDWWPVHWDADGSILAVVDRGSEVLRIAEGSGDPKVLFNLEEGHLHGGTLVPGDRAMLVNVHTGGVDRTDLVLADLVSGRQQEVVRDADHGFVIPTGHLLFQRGDTLMGSRFDLERLEPLGSAQPLLSGVRSFSVSDDGTLVYLPMAVGGTGQRLVVTDQEGNTISVVSEEPVVHVRYSPRGRWISAVGRREIRLMDARSGSVRPLSVEGYEPSDHVWRPDGKAIVYSGFSADGKRGVLFEHPLDGSDPRLLLEYQVSEGSVFPTGYAPDGSGLILARYEDDADLLWLSAEGGEPSPLLATASSEDLGRFSPNGRWVAYESNESGRQEVWVALYRADEGRLAERWQISNQGGRDPLWSTDGGTLYFEDFGNRLIAVPVTATADGQPAFGEHQMRVDLRARSLLTEGDQSYDLAPDGTGFLFVEDTGGVATEVRVVLGWFAELDRLFP